MSNINHVHNIQLNFDSKINYYKDNILNIIKLKNQFLNINLNLEFFEPEINLNSKLIELKERLKKDRLFFDKAKLIIEKIQNIIVPSINFNHVKLKNIVEELLITKESITLLEKDKNELSNSIIYQDEVLKSVVDKNIVCPCCLRKLHP